MSEFTTNISIRKLFFSDYFSNKATKFSWVESILLSVALGFHLENIFWGLGVCFLLIILEGVPLISVTYSLLFSFIEAALIFKVALHYLSVDVSCLIALLFFFVLVSIHKTVGKINCAAFGFAMILFEEILIIGLLYLGNNQIHVSYILILAGIFFLMCISFCRIAATFLFTITTAGFIYIYGQQFLSPPYIISISLLTLCYSGTVYLWAFLGNDYIGLYRRKKFHKMLKAKEKEMPEIQRRMYEKYPVLAGQYQYYQTSVCNDSEERLAFDTDWKHYLIYLDSSSRSITFNQFFEREKLYQIRRYKQNPYRTNPYHTSRYDHQKTGKSNFPDKKNGTSYFAGVNDIKSLKKRYHDLLKIYHPDNQNGDTTVSKQIQEEYDILFKKYK